VLQVVIAGLAMGAIYAIIALSFVLLYNSAQAMNFALGEFVMIGAFINLTFVKLLGFDPWLSVLLTLAAMALLGALFEYGVYHPLRNRSPLSFGIATVALQIIFKNGSLIIYGPDPRGMRSLVGAGNIDVFGAVISPQSLFIIFVTLLLLGCLYLLFFKTRVGRRMRATAQDKVVTQMLGVNTNFILIGTFALATMLAGLGGWLLAPVIFVFPDMGGSILLKAFVATVIGGFGSILGAVVGGLSFGVLEVLIASYISSTFRDVICYSILILVLLIVPRGLFGEAVAEKV
jgi:branched-chain amino acid transport system permease protein